MFGDVQSGLMNMEYFHKLLLVAPETRSATVRMRSIIPAPLGPLTGMGGARYWGDASFMVPLSGWKTQGRPLVRFTLNEEAQY